jgi:hypothetical protein
VWKWNRIYKCNFSTRKVSFIKFCSFRNNNLFSNRIIKLPSLVTRWIFNKDTFLHVRFQTLSLILLHMNICQTSQASYGVIPLREAVGHLLSTCMTDMRQSNQKCIGIFASVSIALMRSPTILCVLSTSPFCCCLFLTVLPLNAIVYTVLIEFI